MNVEITHFSRDLVFSRVGLPVSTSLKRDSSGVYLDVIPEDFDISEGFSVQFRLGWRSAEASLVFGPFARGLIGQMGLAPKECKECFVDIASVLESKGLKVQIKINGGLVHPPEAVFWSSAWTSLELLIRKFPIEVSVEDIHQHRSLVSELVVPIFSLVTNLIGVQEDDDLILGEVEGTPSQTLVTKYERSRLNRELCIQIKGDTCLVCGFNFGEVYGPLGDGFIEIHHLKPVSSIKEGLKVNIKTDLVPLCSNCHSMVHRQKPPLGVEDLRGIIQKRGSLET